MDVQGEEVARRTRATRLWNWRRNSTSITTWLGGGELKSPTHSVWQSARSKSGSRIAAWNSRKNWGPSRRSTNRHAVSVKSKRAPFATAVVIIITRAISITITMPRRRDFINSINSISSTDNRTGTSTTSSSITTIYFRPPHRLTMPPTSAKWLPRAWHKHAIWLKKAAYTLSLSLSLSRFISFF